MARALVLWLQQRLRKELAALQKDPIPNMYGPLAIAVFDDGAADFGWQVRGTAAEQYARVALRLHRSRRHALPGRPVPRENQVPTRVRPTPVSSLAAVPYAFWLTDAGVAGIPISRPVL